LTNDSPNEITELNESVFQSRGIDFHLPVSPRGRFSDQELRRLESAYSVQLGEYADALKSGEIIKAEQDK